MGDLRQFQRGGGQTPNKTPSKTCERGGGAIFFKEISIESECLKIANYS